MRTSLRSWIGGRSATGRHGRAGRSERHTPRLPEAADDREAEAHRGFGVTWGGEFCSEGGGLLRSYEAVARQSVTLDNLPQDSSVISDSPDKNGECAI